jgi:hypothetical protein
MKKFPVLIPTRHPLIDAERKIRGVTLYGAICLQQADGIIKIIKMGKENKNVQKPSVAL